MNDSVNDQEEKIMSNAQTLLELEQLIDAISYSKQLSPEASKIAAKQLETSADTIRIMNGQKSIKRYSDFIDPKDMGHRLREILYTLKNAPIVYLHDEPLRAKARGFLITKLDELLKTFNSKQ